MSGSSPGAERRCDFRLDAAHRAVPFRCANPPCCDTSAKAPYGNRVWERVAFREEFDALKRHVSNGLDHDDAGVQSNAGCEWSAVTRLGAHLPLFGSLIPSVDPKATAGPPESCRSQARSPLFDRRIYSLFAVPQIRCVSDPCVSCLPIAKVRSGSLALAGSRFAPPDARSARVLGVAVLQEERSARARLV